MELNLLYFNTFVLNSAQHFLFYIIYKIIEKTKNRNFIKWTRQIWTDLKNSSKLRSTFFRSCQTVNTKFYSIINQIQFTPGLLLTFCGQRRKLISLFKQATIGNVNTDRKGIHSIVEQMKWCKKIL
jgi:hypothetical protein